MEAFEIYFYFNSIRFNYKTLYKATVLKAENGMDSTYTVEVTSRELNSLYGPLCLIKQNGDWKLDYAGDVDLFNLAIEVAGSIEMYESQNFAEG